MITRTLSTKTSKSRGFFCQVCNQFHAQAAHIFGKRADPVELSLDGDCCSGDLCNHHVLVHASTTTTSSPTDGKVIYFYENHRFITQKNVNKHHYHTDALVVLTYAVTYKEVPDV